MKEFFMVVPPGLSGAERAHARYDATDLLPSPATGALGSPVTASDQVDAALINERRARSRCVRIALAPRSASRRRTASNISRCCTL